MKKKLAIGSMFIITILMLIPATSAIEGNTQINNYFDIDLDQIFDGIPQEFLKENEELIRDFIEELKNNPDLIENIENEIEELESILPVIMDNSIGSRIWSLINRYLLIRFYISFYRYSRHSNIVSKIRLMKWTIKLLAWNIIRFQRATIDPQPMPNIIFSADYYSNTLTVTSISLKSYEWNDIQIDGECNTTLLGEYVETGDTITNCSGEITITYIPTNYLLGIWSFKN